jgi:hypothetical protein
MPAALHATELSSTLPSFRVSVGLPRGHTTFDTTNCGSSVDRLRNDGPRGTLRQVIP